MNKTQYQQAKRAYEITVNGCGKDCFNCAELACICDNLQIQKDAAMWIRQKNHERDFYHRNRERRLNAIKSRYKKKERTEYPTVNQAAFDALPDEFTYDIAAAIWQIHKNAAVERIKKFLVINPNCLTKQKTSIKTSIPITLRKVKNEKIHGMGNKRTGAPAKPDI